MNHRCRRGLTLIELLLAMAAVACLFFVVRAFAARLIPQGCQSNCKNNQKQLMLAAIMYRDSQGKNLEFPQYSGSAFLTALYVSGVNTEADQYICPRSGDDNADMIFATTGNTGELTSYAGRRNANQRVYPGIFTAKGASETATVSDDGEGAVAFNHGDACVIAFADGHVEEVPLDDARMKGVTDVGQGILEPLAN